MKLIIHDSDSKKTSSLPPLIKRPRTTKPKPVSSPSKLVSLPVEKTVFKKIVEIKESEAKNTEPKKDKIDAKTDSTKTPINKDSVKSAEKLKLVGIAAHM